MSAYPLLSQGYPKLHCAMHFLCPHTERDCSRDLKSGCMRYLSIVSVLPRVDDSWHSRQFGEAEIVGLWTLKKPLNEIKGNTLCFPVTHVPAISGNLSEHNVGHYRSNLPCKEPPTQSILVRTGSLESLQFSPFLL